MQAHSECRANLGASLSQDEKAYEQLSLLFNLIQVAANGAALPRPLGLGLYGPIILISKNDYITSGGHESVSKSVVEDMALGRRLKEAASSTGFLSATETYRCGCMRRLKNLLQGWTKIWRRRGKTLPTYS
jgi:4,4'-diaponeurosporenoate glycosyltransferase